MTEREGFVEYAEARDWFVWLRPLFTPHDLANSMGISVDLAIRFCRAGEVHGILENTGASLNGGGMEERIYGYVPLPPGPTVHPTRMPEWISTPGCYAEAPRRGRPVPGTSGAGSLLARKIGRSTVGSKKGPGRRG